MLYVFMLYSFFRNVNDRITKLQNQLKLAPIRTVTDASHVIDVSHVTDAHQYQNMIRDDVTPPANNVYATMYNKVNELSNWCYCY